jgi:hypothetical protein
MRNVSGGAVAVHRYHLTWHIFPFVNIVSFFVKNLEK